MPTRPPIHGTAQRQAARQQQRRDFDKARQSAHDRKFYCSTAWRRLRRAVLNQEPLCRECARHGRTVAATEVDHITDRRDAMERALDASNLQPLCKRCHSRKTAKTTIAGS